MAETKNEVQDIYKNNGIHILMEDIKESSCKAAIEFILDYNFSEKKPKNLKLIINSLGGSLPDAFSLIDIMKGSAIPVHTLGLGCIASAGLLIFITGEKGKRILTPNTSILSHQFSWSLWGKQHELISGAREIDLTEKKMINHYRKCTGLKEKTIKEILLPSSDVWLSAEEAIKYNLADEIKETY